MALSYDFTKVIAREGEGIVKGDNASMAESMVWMTMCVGMNLDSDTWGSPHETDEDQALEFAARLIFAQRQGPLILGVTEEQIVEAVWTYRGLRTNVSYETREEWAERTARVYLESAERFADSAIRDADKAEVA